MSATSFPTTLSTLPALWAWRVATTPALPAYQRFDNARQTWQTLSWAEADAQVQRWVRALSVEPLAHGARVAILLPNGLDHVCIDQAAMARGCVPVPLHALDNPGSIAYILSDAAVSVLLVERLSQWQAIRMTGTLLPALKRVVVMEPYADQDDEDKRVRLLSTWLEQPESAAVPALPTEPPTADDLATIVYTSGTTGKPKGVMLTHRNVVANVKAVLEHIVTRADDVYLSFLPLSHTFERTAGYYVPVAAGSCVAYARSVPQLAEDLLTVRPTVLVSVPRIYERVYAALQQKVEGSALKSGLMAWAQAVGWRRFRTAQGLPLAPEDRSAWAWADGLVWPLLDRAVGAQLRARFGGRLRVAVSGGAALSGAIARCFLGLGVPVVQGYGMTETSPVVAANQPDRNDPATVGSALPGVEVMLAPDGELLVRGPSVMKGYWNRAEDTARVLQADGWLHTGDLASLEGGRVRIRGRLKEIIVTSTGEKIPPADLELAITADPLFEQAWVMGENRPFLTAFVVLNRVQWQHCAESLGVDAQPASLQLPAVRDALLQRVVKQVANFPRHGVPKAVWPTLDPWTLDNSLMTPTLKLKRHNLAQHFESEIEQVYAPK